MGWDILKEAFDFNDDGKLNAFEREELIDYLDYDSRRSSDDTSFDWDDDEDDDLDDLDEFDDDEDDF